MYIDGFVIAVPTANKQKFIDHAKYADSAFVDMGAIRIVDGKIVMFRDYYDRKTVAELGMG